MLKVQLIGSNFPESLLMLKKDRYHEKNKESKKN